MTDMLCSGRVRPWGDDRAPIVPDATGQPSELIDAAELGRRLGVSRSTVYANSATFGAIRLGFGPRAPLRFDYAAVLAALPTAAPRGATPPAPVRRPTRTRAGNRLLEDRPRFSVSLGPAELAEQIESPE